MAIINSLGVGRAKKSAGNLTYRTMRGRCIASQRREKTGRNQLFPTKAQALFALISSFMKAHGSDIQVSFNKSTYGSERNAFYKLNKSGLEAALQSLALKYSATGNKPDIPQIDEAIATYAKTNQKAIFRVSLRGFDDVYLTGAWNSDDNPIAGGAVDDLGKGTATVSGDSEDYTGKIACSLSFYPGAKIVRNSGSADIQCVGLPADITAEQIKYLNGAGSEIEELTVTEVTSSTSGRLKFNAPEVVSRNNAVAIQAGSVFVRLTSPYVSRSTGGSPL